MMINKLPHLWIKQLVENEDTKRLFNPNSIKSHFPIVLRTVWETDLQTYDEQTDILTNRQMDIQTDKHRQIDGQTKRQTENKQDWQTDSKVKYIGSYWWTDRQTVSQTDRQMDRQTVKWSILVPFDGQMDRRTIKWSVLVPVDGQINRLSAR